MPGAAREMHVRLLVCAHMGEAGHRGVEATLSRLRRYCVGTKMEEDAKEVVGQYLYCADYMTGGGAAPVRVDEARSRGGEVVYFHFLHIGHSEDASAVDAQEGYKYVLVVEDDFSGFVRLAPAKQCTSIFTAGELVRWCATFGKLSVSVSDNATHFKDRLLRKVAKELGIRHHFTVVESAWANGTVERAMCEVIWTTKVFWGEQGKLLGE